jgi:hypothetical protein
VTCLDSLTGDFAVLLETWYNWICSEYTRLHLSTSLIGPWECQCSERSDKTSASKEKEASPELSERGASPELVEKRTSAGMLEKGTIPEMFYKSGQFNQIRVVSFTFASLNILFSTGSEDYHTLFEIWLYFSGASLYEYKVQSLAIPHWLTVLDPCFSSTFNISVA